MKCGAPSNTVKMRTFAWCPPAARMFGILAMIFTKRQRVEVPFCNQHKNHFLMRVLGVLGGLAALLAFGFAAFVGVMALAGPNNPNGDGIVGGVCGSWFVLLLVFAVTIGIYNYMTTIRCTLITDREIGLANVAPEFARAVEDEEDELERDAFRDRDRSREKGRPAPRDDEDRVQRRPDRTPPRRPTDARDDAE